MRNMDNSVKIKGKEKFFYGLGDLSANILLRRARRRILCKRYSTKSRMAL